MNFCERSALLIGNDNVKKLKESSVCVFGVGGVGGFVVEALVRSGVGNITVFDCDKISESNVNRQIIATSNNIGKDKTEEIRLRASAINPEVVFTVHNCFYLPENSDKYNLGKFDYIVDAVDTVSAKIEIIRKATEGNVPVISCMGTGGKTDINRLKVSYIEKTNVCPLAKVMRKELKDRGIKNIKVIWSDEEPIKAEESEGKKRIIPSMIFVPAAAGLMIAKEVVFDIIGRKL